jgi:hypothetical protein
LGKEGKERRMIRHHNIIKHNIYEGRGNKNVLNAAEKWSVGGKSLKENNGRG